MPDNQRSRIIREGYERSPNRAMLRATSFWQVTGCVLSLGGSWTSAFMIPSSIPYDGLPNARPGLDLIENWIFSGYRNRTPVSDTQLNRLVEIFRTGVLQKYRTLPP